MSVGCLLRRHLGTHRSCFSPEESDVPTCLPVGQGTRTLLQNRTCQIVYHGRAGRLYPFGGREKLARDIPRPGLGRAQPLRLPVRGVHRISRAWYANVEGISSRRVEAQRAIMSGCGY